MKCLPVLLFALGIHLSAAITEVTVSGATSTRAILSYTAPNSSACTVEVSENSNYLPAVYDVDTVKFSGANLDSRPDSIRSGRRRVFVVGKRAAELALDNRRYSRALQANTQHYFRIKCPNGDTATGQFQTQNIVFGNTHADPLPVDPSRPGEYAWPTLSYSDRSEKHVDPLTGALIRRVTLPQDRYINWGNGGLPVAFTGARTTGWVNKDSALLNNGSFATVSGNNTAFLYLTAKDSLYWANGSGYFIQASYANNIYSLNYFQTTINAKVSGCPGGPDDCKIVVCLTLNNTTCYTGGMQFEQTLTTTATDYVFGTRGVDLWQSPGVRPPNGPEVATRQGTVICDGSNNVTRTGAIDPFNVLWTSGSNLNINNVDYTVASVGGLNNIVLTSPCPTTNGASVPYVGDNFGVLIRKKTASADTVSVQHAQVSYQLGVHPYFADSGAFDLCGPTPVVGPTGNQGYNCAIPNGGPLYWIDGTTGEPHMFGRNINNGCGGFDSVVFDTTDPDTYYCGGLTPVKVKYVGNHSEPTNTAIPGEFEEPESLPTCVGSPAANQPCVIVTNLTGAATLPALTAQFDPSFQSDRFLNINLVGVENGHVIYRPWRGNAETLGWTVVFDPYATTNGEPGNAGCVGGGNPGCIIAAQSSWQSPGARWCTMKSNTPVFTPGWLDIGPYFNGVDGETAAGRGPWNSTSATAFSSTVDAIGGPTTCPSNTFGITGKNCTTVTVDGEPRDFSPCSTSAALCGGAVESGAPGEYGNAALGDYFNLGSANGETARLILKSGTSWTLQRGYAGSPLTSGTLLYAVCNSQPNPNPDTSHDWYWNYTGDPHGKNVSGSSILTEQYSVNAHFYWQNGTNAAASSGLDSRCNVSDGADCYQTHVGAFPSVLAMPPTAVVQANPFFAGKHGYAGNNQVQAHPAGIGFHSPLPARNYFLDGRPFNGGPLSGSADGSVIGTSPAVLVSGQLWKFTAAQTPNLDRKYMATFAFVGPKALYDISGPATGNALSDTAADAYKYCVTVQPNECRQGSAVGDVYVNAPYVHLPYCSFPGQATPGSDDFDICIGNNAMVYNSMTQVGLLNVDLTGASQRVLSNVLARNRLQTVFWHPNALANSRWAIIDSGYAADGFRTEVFAVKVPPPPTPDTLNRGTFIPVTVTVPPPPPPGVPFTNVIVEFGYSENGAAANLFCTTRAESCAVGRVTGANTIDAANPFYFETTEAGLLTGTPCGRGCDIAAPALSQHVLYGRIAYRNGANAVVARSAMFAVSVP